MIYFVLFLYAILLFFFIELRIITLNPHFTLFYSFKDLYNYFKYKQWRNCRKDGRIDAYTGLFGKGKTLSAVHYVTSLYDRYNNKLVYDFTRKKWVVQKIMILSNVHLNGYPYTYLTSLSQIVSVSNQIIDLDNKNDTKTYTFALCDEMSVQMNSRDFKNNIDSLFLNSLLTCRHYRMGLVYTAQRFCDVDALLRRVTSHVISCDKKWRLMVHKVYDANECENATNILLVKPIRRMGWFVRDKHFDVYDTLACVENLKKDSANGVMLSETEILNNIAFTPNDDGIIRRSYKYKKLRKVQ